MPDKSSELSSPLTQGKTRSDEFQMYVYSNETQNGGSGHNSSFEDDEGDLQEGQVKRALKPRHVSMIALGGTCLLYTSRCV